MNQTPPAFHMMIKPRGAICNLDCHYCFYLKKEDLYPQSSFRMSDEVLESYTRQYIKAQQVPEVVFAWQGGEPTLMGLDFFRKAVAFQEQYKKPGMRIQNALQTNGTLLDAEWCQFFHDQHFLIGISLDGPRALHDAYRVDKGGNPTFDRVMRGVERMKHYRVEFNVLACVNAVTAREPLAVYRFLRDEVGARFIQFIPIVERQNATGFQEGELVSERSVSGRAYGRFLNTIFDEWVRRDVAQVYVQIFDVALAAWTGNRPGLCIFEETCGQALAMEHNGDLYACDHYVEPLYRLGNMMERPLVELVGSEAQQKFGQDKRDSLPHYCRACPVRFVCNGGCPKDRFLRTPPTLPVPPSGWYRVAHGAPREARPPEGALPVPPSGWYRVRREVPAGVSDGSEPGLNYLCAGYKSFFTHIDPPMRVMAGLLAQHRAPAEIMPGMPPLAEAEGRRRHKKH